MSDTAAKIAAEEDRLASLVSQAREELLQLSCG